jgi:hypothetical protein
MPVFGNLLVLEGDRKSTDPESSNHQSLPTRHGVACRLVISSRVVVVLNVIEEGSDLLITEGTDSQTN